MTVVEGPAATTSRGRNSVLAALAPAAELSSELRLVELGPLDVVHETGHEVDEVLFPLSCVISLARREDGDDVDVTTVGREGLVGLPGLLGADVHDTRAVCRVPGAALRLPIASARRLLGPGSEGLPVLHRYIRGNDADLMQRIACGRVHNNQQRAAGWLLKTSDRVGRDAFALTHETLAAMLGVRRATVTDSLAVLQRHRVVRSSRGTVTVLDRTALESAACACYGAFRRALPLTSA